MVIHSQHDQYDLAGRASELLERFYSGDYIIAVHCGLVGVGFDHKWISVSCCLCVLKSMSPAEQEWGRALRQVPGPPPGQFPELNHPNWGVVVTHSALGLREMFEKFQQGVSSDVVKDAPVEQQLRPTVADAYEAGETVLRLSDTKNVKPGDVLELRVPVAVNEANSPKFNLLEELSNTGSLMESTADADAFPNTRMNGSNAEAPSSMSHRGEDAQQLTLLTWQQEVDAIGAKLAEIKSVRTYQVHVEAVLDSTSVQITPAWSDFPAGVEVAKSRAARVIPDADFVQHVGLDWQVMIGQELISYRDYQKRVVLQSKGMSLDQEGEIVVNGVRLKDTMPPAVFDLLVKGLEAELALISVEVPHPNALARPDKAKMETQERYGSQVRRLIHDLFTTRGLISDGMNGRSLVERPVDLLAAAIERVRAKGHEPDFRNNSALVHAAVFGFLKEKTERGWSEHNSEQQYAEAVAVARQFLFRLREQLQWRPLR